MWRRLGQFILKYRILLLVIVLALTAAMGYWASKMQISYDFSRAIPTDNPKYRAYEDFRKKFGEDGNLLVIGVQTDKIFTENFFNSYASLQRALRKIKGVEDVLAMPSAVNLVKDSMTEKLKADTIFRDAILSQPEIDSSASIFLNLPFYRQLLYNPDSNAWLMAVRINKEILNTKNRNAVVENIRKEAETFGEKVNYPGLPQWPGTYSHRSIHADRQ